MPTTLDYASLAAGQLTNAKTTLYTVPGATELMVKTILFRNGGAGDNTVEVWFKVLGGVTEVEPIKVLLNTGDSLVLNDVGLFTAADLIEGKATNNSEVDYVINGGKAT